MHLRQQQTECQQTELSAQLCVKQTARYCCRRRPKLEVSTHKGYMQCRAGYKMQFVSDNFPLLLARSPYPMSSWLMAFLFVMGGFFGAGLSISSPSTIPSLPSVPLAAWNEYCRPVDAGVAGATWQAMQYCIAIEGIRSQRQTLHKRALEVTQGAKHAAKHQRTSTGSPKTICS